MGGLATLPSANTTGALGELILLADEKKRGIENSVDLAEA